MSKAGGSIDALMSEIRARKDAREAEAAVASPPPSIVIELAPPPLPVPVRQAGRKRGRPPKSAYIDPKSADPPEVQAQRRLAAVLKLGRDIRAEIKQLKRTYPTLVDDGQYRHHFYRMARLRLHYRAISHLIETSGGSGTQTLGLARELRATGRQLEQGEKVLRVAVRHLARSAPPVPAGNHVAAMMAHAMRLRASRPRPQHAAPAGATDTPPSETQQ